MSTKSCARPARGEKELGILSVKQSSRRYSLATPVRVKSLGSIPPPPLQHNQSINRKDKDSSLLSLSSSDSLTRKCVYERAKCVPERTYSECCLIIRTTRKVGSPYQVPEWRQREKRLWKPFCQGPPYRSNKRRNKRANERANDSKSKQASGAKGITAPLLSETFFCLSCQPLCQNCIRHTIDTKDSNTKQLKQSKI